MRSSRRLLYGTGAALLLVALWFFASVFGVVPDEYRMVNRRFASIAAHGDLGEAVGLVVIGPQESQNGLPSPNFFTGVAVSSDGYLLTTREVALAAKDQNIWVFIGRRRLEAQLVDADKIADLAVIKVDAEIPRWFRIANAGTLSRLNVTVHAVGHQPLEMDKRSLIDWPLAITQGTVSRIYFDDLGTEWIEHSAPIGERSRGSPLIFNDQVVGLNSSSSAGIVRSVAIAPYRDAILRMIQKWGRGERNGIVWERVN